MSELLLAYSGYVLAILGGIFGFIQLRLRKKAEIEQIELQQRFDKEKQKREKRYQVYKEYLQKLDGINERIATFYTGEEMNIEMVKMIDAIFENPDDLSVISKYMQKVNKFAIQWGQEQNKALDELHGLRLVCSEQILSLLDEYVYLTKSYLDDTLELMRNLDFSKDYMKQIESSNLNAKNERVREIKNKIEKQMRLDIGIN